ncbi:hypothetical protein J2X68_007402 [Streptomyces sp. 3330]|nr:hypothetical protein [Streptomyces sp. 3330]
MKMVNLKGLVRLVNGCTKPACEPFKAWVSDVIQTVQEQGSYTLEPAPVQPAPAPAPAGGTAYVMPEQVVDAIVRLEARNIQADELLAAAREEQTFLLRRISDSQDMIAQALVEIAQTLKSHRPRSEPALESHDAGPRLTPRQLLARWQEKNLVFTEDIHAVAAYLAPALVRGEARHRIEVIATRTGITQARVHDCLRTLLKRGCMRQTGCAADGTPIYVLP